MKKIITWVFILIRCAVEAQSLPSVAYVTNCGIASINGSYVNTGSSLDYGGWIVEWYSVNNCYFIRNPSYAGGFPPFQSMTTNLFGAWTNVFTATFTNPPPRFSATPPPPPPLNLFSAPLSNFWPASGGKIIISAKGIVTSNAVLSLTLNSSAVFQSDPTTNAGALWQLLGTLQLDPSNTLTTAVNFSGQPAQFNVVSNFVSTNVNFSLNLDTSYDTNLTVTSVQIIGQQAVAGAQPVYAWPPGVFQTPYTVTNSSDSTFGFAAGLMAWDTNYVYVSWGTNRWKRASLTTY